MACSVVQNGEIIGAAPEPGEFAPDDAGSELRASLACNLGDSHQGDLRQHRQPLYRRAKRRGRGPARVSLSLTHKEMGAAKQAHGARHPPRALRVVDNNIGLDVDISVVRCNGEYSTPGIAKPGQLF
ncbi:MAG: hypothetical protein ACLU7D_11670 [Collinsella sp.]